MIAVGVSLSTGDAPGPIEDAGRANPGGNFRYDASPGAPGGHVFNLRTAGYAPGVYLLHFTVGHDPHIYSTTFRIE